MTRLKLCLVGKRLKDADCGWQGTRDKENMNLALAMIANCNIEESHTYLSFIICILTLTL